MKRISNLIISGISLLLCTMGFAQTSEFSTSDGIKWGMSQSEIKKIKIDAPLSTQEDQVVFYDMREGRSETYFLSGGELYKIFTNKDVYSKKDGDKYFEKMKLELTDRYGAQMNTVSENLIEWNVSGTKITLSRSLSKKGGLVSVEYLKS